MERQISFSVFSFFLGVAFFASAQESITYPVEELGNCESKEACRAYCELAENREACFLFAEEHNLMSKNEVATARKLSHIAGPGGCHGRACRLYCENAEHHDECMKFAIENGLMTGQAVERAKTFLKNGGPGGCKTRDECRAYCAANQDECRAAGQKRAIEKRGFEIPYGRVEDGARSFDPETTTDEKKARAKKMREGGLPNRPPGEFRPGPGMMPPPDMPFKGEFNDAEFEQKSSSGAPVESRANPVNFVASVVVTFGKHLGI